MRPHGGSVIVRGHLPASDIDQGDVTVIPVVLVEGNDPTLVGEAVEKAIGELLGGEDRSLALEDYEGDEVDLAAVADSCLTPPLLVSRRVIVVRSAGRYSTEDVDPLLRYLGDPLPTTALVLGGGGGQIAPKLVAAAKAKGTVISTTVDSRQAGDWLAERLGQASVRLDREAQNLVRTHLGEDVSAVVPLLELLEAAYGPGAAMGIAPGRSTFPAKKALRSARQWGSANIAEAIGLVADADADLKGASSWAGEAVLEVLVARLCRLARAKPTATHGHRVTPRR
jgi:DNA polymerase III delta subunit